MANDMVLYERIEEYKAGYEAGYAQASADCDAADLTGFLKAMASAVIFAVFIAIAALPVVRWRHEQASLLRRCAFKMRSSRGVMPASGMMPIAAKPIARLRPGSGISPKPSLIAIQNWNSSRRRSQIQECNHAPQTPAQFAGVFLAGSDLFARYCFEMYNLAGAL
jgi:hypothetical protein